MENIRFGELSQIVEFFRGSKKLGYGREGACYKIKTLPSYNTLDKSWSITQIPNSLRW